jgi:ATP-dependent Clp protease, protease subunit
MSKTLKLSGEISEASANALVLQIEAVPTNQTIQLRIASPGGSIFEGTKIMTALRAHQAGVDTINESLAASMASAIFMLGKTRTMAKGSRLMIHRPWVGGISGESADLRRSADLLDSLEKDLVAAYSGPTGIAEDRIREMMEAETWMTPEEAQAFGFATAISGETRNAIPAEYLAKFEHVPSDLVADEPDSEISIVPNTKAALSASVKALTGELQARTKERDDARAALARTKFLLSALERSYGLAAASTVPDIPQVEVADALTTYEALDGEAATAFFKANRDAIMAAENARRYGARK